MASGRFVVYFVKFGDVPGDKSRKLPARTRQKKWCITPGCKSTSKSTPNKVFLTVPKNKHTRQRWWSAVRREPPLPTGVCFCCEDHFKLEEDVKNYMYYKTFGGRILLKQGVVPHIFDCQENVPTNSSNRAPRQRKRMILSVTQEQDVAARTGMSQGADLDPASDSSPFAGEGPSFLEPPVKRAALQEETTVGRSKKTSDVMGTGQKACAAYILPDDPPDLKSDVAAPVVVKVEPEDLVVTAEGDQPDVKPDLTSLKVKVEQQDPLAIPSAATDDLPDLKPDLTSLKVKVEQQDPPAIPSAATGAAGQILGVGSYECVGEDFGCGNITARHGLIKQSESVNEHQDCTYYRILDMSPTGHIRAEKKAFCCGVCKKSSSRKWLLNIHNRTHTGDKPHSCDHCGKAFSQQSGLTRHMPSHTGEKHYKCDDCGKAFALRSILTKHVVIHSGEKHYKCDKCGKTFAHRDYLSQHMLTHTAEKRFKCDDCGKAFAQKGTLNRHMQTHTGEKHYKCVECERAFARRSHLTQHMLTHTGEKPYECDDCGKTFVKRCNLTQHMVTHIGEKHYKCDFCGKAFALRSALTRHACSNAHGGEVLLWEDTPSGTV